MAGTCGILDIGGLWSTKFGTSYHAKGTAAVRGMSGVFARIDPNVMLSNLSDEKDSKMNVVFDLSWLLTLVKYFCWHQHFAQNMQIAADWDLPRAVLTVWTSW